MKQIINMKRNVEKVKYIQKEKQIAKRSHQYDHTKCFWGSNANDRSMTKEYKERNNKDLLS